MESLMFEEVELEAGSPCSTELDPEEVCSPAEVEERQS